MDSAFTNGIRTIGFGSIGVAIFSIAATVAHAAANVEEGGKPDGGLPQLDVSSFPTQIFWLIVSFALLYWIMSKMAVPRIAEVLEERQERITDDLETAERLKSEAEKVQADYEKALADARSKAQAQIKTANDEAAAEQAKAEAEHGKKMARKIKTAETRIGKQRDEALESLMSVASETAVEATTKLIGVTPGDDSVKKAVEAVSGEGRA
jgi:F-type H+-transporting ATPase subunit b